MRLDLAAIELIGGVLLAPSCGRAVIDGARLVVDGSLDGGPAGGVLHLGAANEQMLLGCLSEFTDICGSINQLLTSS